MTAPASPDFDDLPRQWVKEDDRWRVIGPDTHKRCRMMGCRRPAVAELLRGDKRKTGGRWWAYCEHHLFGRRIANGQVESHHVVFPEAENV